MGWAPLSIPVAAAGLTTASTAYTANDQLGTEITLTGAATGNAGYGAIMGIELIDYAKVVGAVDIFFFYDTTTPAADNAANSWSDADALKSIPGSPVQMPPLVGSTLQNVGGLGNLWLPYKTGSGHANLYIDLVTRSGHTFFGVATDLKLNIIVMQYS